MILQYSVLPSCGYRSFFIRLKASSSGHVPIDSLLSLCKLTFIAMENPFPAWDKGWRTTAGLICNIERNRRQGVSQTYIRKEHDRAGHNPPAYNMLEPG
ncbi:hypothetical protein ACOSQ3_026001 [Xanthoceras sorbifolium]